MRSTRTDDGAGSCLGVLPHLDNGNVQHAAQDQQGRLARAAGVPPFGIADDFSFIALSDQYAFVAWADYRPGDRQGFFSAVKFDAFQR